MSRSELHAGVLPRLLGLDIDADDVAATVYQVRRGSADRVTLALCRAGNDLTLLSPGHAIAGNEYIALLLSAFERWRVVAPDHGSFGYVDEPAWPEPVGDVLVLERIEKGMAIIYWQDGGLRARSIYRHVEP